MRIIVLGGTHFIGPAVVERLCNLGHEVAIFHRGRTETSLPEKVRHFHGNRNRIADLGREFRAYAPDVVIDTGLFNEAEAMDVTKVFTHVAKRLVVLSSLDVYQAFGYILGTESGPPQSVPIREDGALRTKLYPFRDKLMTDFARKYDKILVERTVLNNPGLPALVLRLPMVYGARDYQHRLLYWLKPMKLDKRTAIVLGKGYASQRLSRGYVENVANAIALGALAGAGMHGVYNVADSPTLSNLEWGMEIAKCVGWEGKIELAPDDRVPEALRGRGQDLVADTTKIRDELKYRELVSLGDGLKKSAEWELANLPKNLTDFQLFDYAEEDKLLKQLSSS